MGNWVISSCRTMITFHCPHSCTLIHFRCPLSHLALTPGLATTRHTYSYSQTFCCNVVVSSGSSLSLHIWTFQKSDALIITQMALCQGNAFEGRRLLTSIHSHPWSPSCWHLAANITAYGVHTDVNTLQSSVTCTRSNLLWERADEV